MMSYAQYCPLAQAAGLVAERWTLLVLRELVCGSSRFNDLRRGVPRISPTLLSRRLKELVRAGVVEQRRDGYHLTEAGKELGPILDGLGLWGHRWAMGRIRRSDLDPSVLLWHIRGRLRAEKLPRARATIEFGFRGVCAGPRRWWLVVEGGEVELCLQDPGREIDLLVTTDVRTLIAIWLDHLGVDAALRSGRMELDGPSALRRSFSTWLGRSRLVEAARADPGWQGG